MTLEIVGTIRAEWVYTTGMMQAKLDAMTTPCLTLIQAIDGSWQPDCPTTADKLHAIGVDFGPDGISTLAIDDVLYNVSQHGYWLETVPLDAD